METAIIKYLYGPDLPTDLSQLIISDFCTTADLYVLIYVSKALNQIIVNSKPYTWYYDTATISHIYDWWPLSTIWWWWEVKSSIHYEINDEAAKRGDIAYFQLTASNHDHWYSIAAQHGQLALLKSVTINKASLTTLLYHAMKYNQVEVYQWLLVQGAYRCYGAIDAAIKNASLECLKYAMEKGRVKIEDVFNAAVVRGDLEEVKLQWEAGASLAKAHCYAARANQLEILEWLFSKAEPSYSYALWYRIINKGNWQIFAWLWNKGYDINSNAIQMILEEGRLAEAQMIHNRGLKFASNACSSAVSSGNLELVQWLISIGYNYNHTECGVAAREGHFELLRWLHSQGCKWNPTEIIREIVGSYHSRIVEDCENERNETISYRLTSDQHRIYAETISWVVEISADMVKNDRLCNIICRGKW